MDFTLNKYERLLKVMLCHGFSFLPLVDFVKNGASGKTVILRHDVDNKPLNSLRLAQLESKIGIRATYYFRKTPCSFDENILKEIAALGHEIGYHYETLSSSNGNFDLAYKAFVENLNFFRKFAKIETISSHGSTWKLIDNKLLWTKFDFSDLGVIAEATIYSEKNNLFYLTDTGRCWNSNKYNIYDKIKSPLWKNTEYKTTDNIIKSIEEDRFPHQAMINSHPQRWNQNIFFWAKEFVMQNIKNQAKRLIVLKRS